MNGGEKQGMSIPALLLIVLGVLSLAGSAIDLSGSCAKTYAASAIFHIPTCDQTTTTFFVLVMLGIGFIAAGAVMHRRSSRSTAKAPMVPAPVSNRFFCHMCGNALTGVDRYCNRCGTAVVPPSTR
jgi:hypothetical protein